MSFCLQKKNHCIDTLCKYWTLCNRNLFPLQGKTIKKFVQNLDCGFPSKQQSPSWPESLLSSIVVGSYVIW